MWFFRQYLEWYGVGYFDVGRVWPDLKEVGVGGMHWSSGGAMRLSWNKDFVIRFGVGYSVEQVDIFFNLGNAF
jgi:hypothetical protein